MIKVEAGQYLIPEFSLTIDLHVKAGEFCAVLGPSGAGKSTLLSIIAGFEKLESGSIVLDGAPAPRSPSARPVSMVFQDYNVFGHLNVWTNVALGMSPSLRLDDLQKSKVDAALARVGLQSLAHRKPAEISGGERQRIALARVLVRDKPILLLDEPFAALDPGLRRDMLELLRDLHLERNLTVLMVTHQPEEIKNVVKGIVFVADNKVHHAIATEEFFKSNRPDILSYLGRQSLIL
jgi:thiamine transport system ATP-binding protein